MKQRGIIKLILVIVVALILLSYFNVDLRHWADKLEIRAFYLKLQPYLVSGWAKVVDLWHYLLKK